MSIFVSSTRQSFVYKSAHTPKPTQRNTAAPIHHHGQVRSSVLNSQKNLKWCSNTDLANYRNTLRAIIYKHPGRVSFDILKKEAPPGMTDNVDAFSSFFREYSMSCCIDDIRRGNSMVTIPELIALLIPTNGAKQETSQSRKFIKRCLVEPIMHQVVSQNPRESKKNIVEQILGDTGLVGLKDLNENFVSSFFEEIYRLENPRKK